MFSPDSFPSRRLHQARACPGVAAVCPLYIENTTAVWKNAHDQSTRPIRVLAIDPDEPALDFVQLPAYAEALKQPNTVLFDEKSRDYYGHPQPGTQTELTRRSVTVLGTFRLGTDFSTDGSVIMSDRNFLQFFPDRSASGPYLAEVEVGVVQVAPGANVFAVQQELRQRLPDDVVVLTKPELVEQESRYWRDNTVIGYIFSLGMAVGFVVGIIICYQILYTNVLSCLPQFATLKAMGYSDGYLVSVVLQQALFLAVLGFIPAVGAAQVVFWIVARLTGLLLYLTPLRLAFILALTVAMCMTSGIIAVRRVLTADPAEVFK
jgi:putative ABC transport system permease protein